MGVDSCGQGWGAGAAHGDGVSFWGDRIFWS